MKPEFVEGKWDGLIAGLDVKRYDAVINQVGITEERKAKFDFSDPYIASKAALIVREDNADIKGFADLSGKKAAQSLTSNYGKIAEGAGAELVGTDQLSTVDRARRPGPRRRDHQRQPVLPRLQEEAAQRAGEDRRDRGRSGLFFGVIVRKGDPELVAAINQALKDINNRTFLLLKPGLGCGVEEMQAAGLDGDADGVARPERHPVADQRVDLHVADPEYHQRLRARSARPRRPRPARPPRRATSWSGRTPPTTSRRRRGGRPAAAPQ